MRGFQVLKSDKTLKFFKQPSTKSWGQVAGILCLGVSAACFSSEGGLWKVLYFFGAALVAAYLLEEWEEILFDKSQDMLIFKRFSVRDMVLDLMYGTSNSQKTVSVDLNDIMYVRIHSVKLPLYGLGHQLVLVLKSGRNFTMNESYDFRSSTSDFEAAVKIINDFLNLMPYEHYEKLQTSSIVEKQAPDDSQTDDVAED